MSRLYRIVSPFLLLERFNCGIASPHLSLLPQFAVSVEKKAEELRSWQQFMAVFLHIKKEKMKPSSFALPNIDGFFIYLQRRIVQSLKGKEMEKIKFGKWRQEWNEVANRYPIRCMHFTPSPIIFVSFFLQECIYQLRNPRVPMGHAR